MNVFHSILTLLYDNHYLYLQYHLAVHLALSISEAGLHIIIIIAIQNVTPVVMRG